MLLLGIPGITMGSAVLWCFDYWGPAEWIWKFSSLGLQNFKWGCCWPTGRVWAFFVIAGGEWEAGLNWRGNKTWNCRQEIANWCQWKLEDTRAGIQWQKHSEYKVNKTSFFQYIDWGQNSIWIKNQSGCLPWRSKLREDGIFLTVIPFYALSLHTGELKFLRALELHHKNPLKSFTHLYSFYRRQLPLCWTFLELFWGNLSKQWLVTLSLLWPCIGKRLFPSEGIAGGVAAQNR